MGGSQPAAGPLGPALSKDPAASQQAAGAPDAEACGSAPGGVAAARMGPPGPDALPAGGEELIYLIEGTELPGIPFLQSFRCSRSLERHASSRWCLPAGFGHYTSYTNLLFSSGLEHTHHRLDARNDLTTCQQELMCGCNDGACPDSCARKGRMLLEPLALFVTALGSDPCLPLPYTDSPSMLPCRWEHEPAAAAAGPECGHQPAQGQAWVRSCKH